MGTCFSSHTFDPPPTDWEDLPPRQRLGLECKYERDKADPAVDEPESQIWMFRERLFVPKPKPYKWPKDPRL
ncbi:hypothetical protein CcaverHIS641_0110090 [Cutaneotrichosporon cavernicola]|nr:hypothetical protein CcaverHIS641_0110090 [Cutaneotrichosporon cavernicola]